MNSPIANLFLSLQTQIAALADGASNTYFKFVEQDLGQLEDHSGDNRPPVMWPCALIDIDGLDTKDLGQNAQEGVLSVCIRVGFPPFSASSAATPLEYRQKAIYFYDLEQLLHKALQGANPGDISGYTALQDVFGPYTRISARTERRNDKIRVRELRYTIGIDDYSTQTQNVHVPAALNLNANLNLTP